MSRLATRNCVQGTTPALSRYAPFTGSRWLVLIYEPIKPRVGEYGHPWGYTPLLVKKFILLGGLVFYKGSLSVELERFTIL